MSVYFDLYPMIFLAGREQEITIRPLGCGRQVFTCGTELNVSLLDCEIAEDSRYPGSGSTETETAVVGEDGYIRFTHVFPRESMYLIHIQDIPQLRVYALNADMKGRYPFRGDLHMHTNRSDGREPPETVVSNYRGHGYDFTVISDHHRYFPSLETRKFFGIDENDESSLTDMLVVTGEEVHLPGNPVHFVNFGGKFSINALVTPNCNQERNGDDKSCRSFDGNCPDVIPEEKFTEMMKERAKNVPLQNESERLSYAILEWTYEKEKEAEGLGIFAHPYWYCSTMQISEEYTKFIYKNKPFDAFEVLGGESYYQQNGFQTAFYYDMKAKGITCPVVGSTDSHCSYKDNRNALICSTIVFAPENKTKALVSSIKDNYTVAVDTISTEYRLVGDFRFIKYGSFLLENWYPIHDKICAAEGTFLQNYSIGDKNAENVLKAMKGEIPRMMKKYFNID